ncbi:MAG: DUF3291 domain-containing protein [Actinobacteria bacterium]|nr:DUF3291 domain-containing protein [Actinomycetota bacterium]
MTASGRRPSPGPSCWAGTPASPCPCFPTEGESARYCTSSARPAARTDERGPPARPAGVSVWTHYEALHQYVYRSAHGLFMRQRARWFEPISGFTTALWWVTEGDEPSVDVALSHLEHLRAHGPTPQAFSLRRQFDPDGVPVVRS